MPVLSVGYIPELNRVLWVEIFSAECVRMKKPVAHDQCSVGRLRPELMHHHVFGMQTEQHVRKNRIIKHSMLSIVLMLVIVIVLDWLRRVSIMSRSTITSTTGMCDPQRAGVAAHGQTLARIDLHESAEERTFSQIVLRRIVG